MIVHINFYLQFAICGYTVHGNNNNNSNNNNKKKIKNITAYYLKQHGGKLLFSCNLRKDDLSRINIPNEFLKEILELWTEVHFIQSKGLEVNDIKNQLIWYNSCIRVKNKPVYTTGIGLQTEYLGSKIF